METLTIYVSKPSIEPSSEPDVEPAYEPTMETLMNTWLNPLVNLVNINIRQCKTYLSHLQNITLSDILEVVALGVVPGVPSTIQPYINGSTRLG